MEPNHPSAMPLSLSSFSHGSCTRRALYHSILSVRIPKIAPIYKHTSMSSMSQTFMPCVLQLQLLAEPLRRRLNTIVEVLGLGALALSGWLLAT